MTDCVCAVCLSVCAVQGKHQTLKPSFQNTEEDRVGPILLVLGFRAPDADFLYSKDWAFFSTSHVVLPLSTQTESSTLWSGSPLLSNEKWSCTTLLGFSRSDASIKVYVQDAILHNATTVGRTRVLQILTLAGCCCLSLFLGSTFFDAFT